MAVDSAIAVPRAAIAPTPGWFELTVRAFRCWLTSYRRLWRASIYSSVLGPVFYLGEIGRAHV